MVVENRSRIGGRSAAALARLVVTLLVASATSQVAASCGGSGEALSAKMERGQVFDYESGLTWQRCLVGKTWDDVAGRCSGAARSMTRDAAVEYVMGLKPAQDGVWRLPTPVELMTLADFRCRAGDRGLKWFSDPDAQVLWSSEVYRPTPDYAWGLSVVKAELIYQLRMDEFQMLLVKAKR